MCVIKANRRYLRDHAETDSLLVFFVVVFRLLFEKVPCRH